jgi:hypothetical protein
MADSNREDIYTRLANTTLKTITEIRPNIDPAQMLLLGPDAVDAMLPRWSELERSICAAKLAIVRDEFRARFPQFRTETEGFTFGIIDKAAERYENLLKPRNADDLFQVGSTIVEEVFGKRECREIPGIAHFASNLTQMLQHYSRSIEELLLPFALEIGVPPPQD